MRSLHTKRFLAAWEDSLELVQVHLTKAAIKTKKCANKEKRDTHFKVGDMLFLKIIGVSATLEDN